MTSKVSSFRVDQVAASRNTSDLQRTCATMLRVRSRISPAILLTDLRKKLGQIVSQVGRSCIYQRKR